MGCGHIALAIIISTAILAVAAVKIARIITGNWDNQS